MMTKRRDIIKIIATAAAAQGVSFTVSREGSRHTVHDLDGIKIPIARHNEIGNQMAEVIYKEAAAKLGKDWWKK
jgi:alpha-L-fucosidase